VVESNGKFACELEVLRLVFTDRYVRSVVEKDVGCLEDGVGEETKFKSIFIGSRFEWRSIGG